MTTEEVWLNVVLANMDGFNRKVKDIIKLADKIAVAYDERFVDNDVVDEDDLELELDDEDVREWFGFEI
jgi:hypothetical protein